MPGGLSMIILVLVLLVSVVLVLTFGTLISASVVLRVAFRVRDIVLCYSWNKKRPRNVEVKSSEREMNIA
jgi:hypothetical protein